MAGTGQGEAADRFVDAATLFLSRQIAGHLRTEQLTAATLAKACGGAESTWRSKLNGHRTFQLDDLARIAATVDPTVMQALNFSVGDGRDLLPNAERAYLRLAPGSLPRLWDGAGVWAEFSRSLNTWLTAEVEAGRIKMVTPDVLVHRALQGLSGHGLPFNRALFTVRDTHTVLEWREPSRAVVLWWQTQTGTEADLEFLGDLKVVAQNRERVLLVAASTGAVMALQRIASADGGWFALTGLGPTPHQQDRESALWLKVTLGEQATCWTAEVRTTSKN